MLWEKGNAADYILLAVVVAVLCTANGEELANVQTEVQSAEQVLAQGRTLAGEHTSAGC